MILIKRYPNRKLYDTEAKSYIALEGVAELIRQGHEIQVIDHATGEDLTTVILTQIILEQEKKQAGSIPRSVLTGLVQAGEFTLSKMRQALVNPIEFVQQIDEEIERRIDALIDRGELAEEEAGRMREKLLTSEIEPPTPVHLDEATIKRLIVEQGVPTQEDLKKISDQLEILAAKINELLED